jgi:hypothetical protein
MLRGFGIVVAGALVAVPAGLAGLRLTPPVGGMPTFGDDTATGVLSSDVHGAKPVALVIRLHAELQCGRFMSTAITVSLPTSMRVPSSLSKRAVMVADKAAGSVATSGTRVLIHPTALKPGAICDVIGPGVVAITFTRFAGLGNPQRVGSYAFDVVAAPRGGQWRGVLTIH